jgi:hypothetical protein
MSLPPRTILGIIEVPHFLGFLAPGFWVLEPFFVKGIHPHPQVPSFFSAICITSSLLGPISSALDFFDALLEPGQLLLQLVPVCFQAFMFLLGRKETPERWSASATTTTTGATRHNCIPLISSRLTHSESPPFQSKLIPCITALPLGHANPSVSGCVTIPMLPWRYLAEATRMS